MSTDQSQTTISENTLQERWETECQFRDREIALKESDVRLREAEIELKRSERAVSLWRSPLVIAILAATVAALGNAGVAFTNGKQQRAIEELKSEHTRILEMIKTGDPDEAAENLNFLLDAGLISNPETITKLREPLKTPGFV